MSSKTLALVLSVLAAIIVLASIFFIFQNFLLNGSIAILGKPVALENTYSISGGVGNHQAKLGNSQLLREILDEIHFYDSGTAHIIGNTVETGATVKQLKIIFSPESQSRPLIVSNNTGKDRSTFSMVNSGNGIVSIYINISDLENDGDQLEKLAQVSMLSILYLIRNGYDATDPTANAVKFGTEKSSQISRTNQERIVVLE